MDLRNASTLKMREREAKRRDRMTMVWWKAGELKANGVIIVVVVGGGSGGGSTTTITHY